MLNKAGLHFQTNAICSVFFLQGTDLLNSGRERAHDLILHGLVGFLLLEILIHIQRAAKNDNKTSEPGYFLITMGVC